MRFTFNEKSIFFEPLSEKGGSTFFYSHIMIFFLINSKIYLLQKHAFSNI